FSGYTTEYSLAVWTGYPSLKNEDGDVQYIRYDGTQDIAKQLFRELMTTVSSPDTADFTKPDSVISVGSELYVRGAEPPQPSEYQSGSDEEQEEEPDEQEEEPEEEEEDPEEEQEDEETEDQEDDAGDEDNQADEEEEQRSEERRVGKE